MQRAILVNDNNFLNFFLMTNISMILIILAQQSELLIP